MRLCVYFTFRAFGNTFKDFFRRSWVIPFLLILTVGALGCDSSKTRSSSEAETPAKSVVSVDRGRAVYQTQCIACHHSDPHKPGSIGPDVFGSSKELLAARILKGEYPPGYLPKRSTHSMVALPHLKNEIDSIHAFLNQSQ